MSRRVLTSVLFGGLALAVASCGSRTTNNKRAPSAAGAAFCDALASKLESCKLEAQFSAAPCLDAIAGQQDAAIARGQDCLDGPCEDVVSCVDAELGPVVTPIDPGGSGGTGAGGGASSLDCPGAPVRCLDPDTAEYCNATTSPQLAICAQELAAQGIVSNGCSSDASGDGCTVDALMDPDCEAGAPVFAVCEGLIEADLVSTYVACYQNLNGASLVIPCYQDFVDAAQNVVDCTAARTSCAQP